MLTPPEKNLELFEKYLPYAIALGVENEWAEKFDSIIQQAIATGYQPAYFRGTAGSFSNNFNVAAMSAGISSGLSSTISSASLRRQAAADLVAVAVAAAAVVVAAAVDGRIITAKI